MAEPLDPVARLAECRAALREATRYALRHQGSYPDGVGLADIIAEHLERNGFRVHYKRVRRNGRGPNGPALTKAQIREIRRLRRDHPRMLFATIAAKVGTNAGRVSEALAGMRS